VTVAVTLSLTGCGAAVDRAGNEPDPHVVTITAVTNLNPFEMEPFVDAVLRLSHGTLKLRLKNQWHVNDVGGEADEIRYVRTRHVTLAFVPARAWSGIGVHSFDALLAPMTVDSYALERQVLAGDLPSKMLASVSPLGLTGLGILPGPMRKPVGISRTLLGPDDYRGATIGISKSVVAARFFSALGARSEPSPFFGSPINGFDGIEQQVDSISGNRYDRVAHVITGNVSLWPRPITVVANTKMFARLPSAQQDVLRRAARMSLDESLLHQETDEHNSTGILCRRGAIRFATASDAQVLALREAAKPVLAWLSQDRATTDYLARIEQMRADVAISADAEEVPSCDGIAPDLPAHAAAAGKPGPLDGTWTMSETAADVQAAGAPKGDLSDAPENSGDWVFVVDRERFAFTQRNGPACTWAYGTWVVSGDQVEWRVIDGGGIAPTNATNKPGELFDYHWSLYRDTLQLSKVDGAVSPENFFGNPWRQVSAKPEPDRFFSRCGLPSVGVPH
jgi:TRAP-type C4-dicarboxylate transport system substrate-binding protein